jgi:hypothetical protein
MNTDFETGFVDILGTTMKYESAKRWTGQGHKETSSWE